MGNSEILKYSKCLHNIKDIKNILTIQSKVLSHFTEKSVVRKHIKSDNQTDNEGEKSFLSALIVMHVFSRKGSPSLIMTN